MNAVEILHFHICQTNRFETVYLVFYEYWWVLCAGEKHPPETIDVALYAGQFHLGGMVLHLKEIYRNV